MSSLRTRITILATAISFVLLLVVAGTLLVVQRRQLNGAVDAALRDAAVSVQQDLSIPFANGDRQDGRPRRVDDETIRQFFSRSPQAFQVVNREGTVVLASGLPEAESVVAADVLFAATQSGDFRTVNTESRGRYRVVSSAFGPERALIVGYSMADVDAAQRALTRNLLLLIPILAGLLGALIWSVTGRALQPVERMRREVDAISSDSLSARLSTPDTDELGRLASTLNGMLSRIQASVDAQQRFVSDASHELRSPLTGIRSQLEVSIAHPEAPGREHAELEMLSETIRMQALVEDLLALARSDEGRQHVSMAVVDLDDIVLREVTALVAENGLGQGSDYAEGDQRPPRVDVSGVSAAQLVGNADQLLRVVRNLLSNAVRHAENSVWVTLGENPIGGGDAEIVLSVSDDGPGVGPDVLGQIFERFVRSDEARDRDSGGSGLGLAIVRSIVKGHSGTVDVESDHSGGARFVVRFPSTQARS